VRYRKGRRFYQKTTIDLDEKLATLGLRHHSRARVRGALVGAFLGWWATASVLAKVFVGLFVVAGLMYVARLLQRPRPDRETQQVYGFTSRTNAVGTGTPVPIIYGEHRHWPAVVQEYVDVVNNISTLYRLYCLGEGPIESVTGIELNNQPIEFFNGVSWQVRYGHPVQTVIPWFADNRNTYHVGIELLADGRSFIYRTITPIDEFIVRVLFPQGLTGSGGATGSGTNSVTVRVEHRILGDVPWTLLGNFVVNGVANDTRPILRQFRSGPLTPITVKLPGSVTNNNSIGGTAWTNPAHALTSNDQWAVVDEPTSTPRDTQYLLFTDFQMNLPGDAVVNGIQVEVERHHAPGGVSGGNDWLPEGPPESTYDRSVRLYVNGTFMGENKADTTTAWPTTDATKSYGGPSDLWGLTSAELNPTTLNASNFGFGIAARVDNGSAKIDAATIRVYYTSSSVPGIARREIRVTRVSTSSTPKPPMSFDSIDEISYGSILNTYPNIAILGLKVQASEQLSGSVTTSCLVRGRTVRQLTDGELSTTESWSQNPVECLIDLLTNARYGLGTYITDADLLLSSFQTAKDYCNEIVEGETRHQLDIIMDEYLNAWDWLEVLLNTCRGILIESDGRWKLGVDHLTEPSQVFTNANIVKGTFTNAWVSLSEEYDTVEGIYFDRELDYRRESVFDPVPAGRRIKSIQIKGIVRRSHALREVRYHRRVIELTSRFIEFETSIEALGSDVMDVILVSHDVPKWGMSGRVVSVSGLTITVDRNDLPTDVATTDYDLIVRQQNGDIEQRAITAISAPYVSSEGHPRQDITIASSFASSPVPRNTLWVLVLAEGD
jgi:hypothetical protein